MCLFGEAICWRVSSHCGGKTTPVNKNLQLPKILHKPGVPTIDKYNQIYVYDAHWWTLSSVLSLLLSVRLLCRAVVKELLPTPAKFHYIFNLRDLSRVYAGLCQTTKDVCKRVYEFLRVWRNECLRVFSDRLISEEDQGNIRVRKI